MTCPHGQLQISVELQGVDLGAAASYLVGTLSVRGNVKLTSLSFKLVFQLFPVSDKLEPWWFLGCSLNNFLSSDCDSLGLLTDIEESGGTTCVQLFELMILNLQLFSCVTLPFCVTDCH